MGRPRSDDADLDHWMILGLTPGSSVEAIVEARRRIAKRAHPDAGGGVGEMQRVNAAADSALAELAGPKLTGTRRRAGTPAPARREPRRTTGDSSAFHRTAPSADGRTHDHPSFVIEALPAEAFEALLVAVGTLGVVVDDDPPYRLEADLADELRCWCELRLVPDAGASTVSLTIAAEPGFPSPGVERVRDALVAELNQLDWDDLDESRPRPS